MAKKAQSQKAQLTPLMRQYFDMKAKHPDALLLYRVGDFYETFGDDARLIADLLGIVLTNRNNGGSQIPLAGFPYHSIDTYLPKLVKAGYRVAICEQLEKPSKDKKIVKRGVTEMVTPGITHHDDILERNKANYLCAIMVSEAEDRCGMALLDYSTGKFMVYEGSQAHTTDIIRHYEPKEILHMRSQALPIEIARMNTYKFALDDWVFDLEYASSKVLRQFNVQSLKGYGIEHMTMASITSGVILHYLETTQNNQTDHINQLHRIVDSDFLWLDTFTVRNLELTSPLQSGGSSLYDVLNRTVSPMGGRMLNQWILFPLLDHSEIINRQQRIESMVTHDWLREELTSSIKDVGDLERLTTRISNEKLNPRQVAQLAKSLEVTAQVKAMLAQSELAQLSLYADSLDPCLSLKSDIDSRFVAEPPVVLGKGPTIKPGFDAELDEWRAIISNSKQMLVDIQSAEIERTSIQNLKIGFNNVFGYYLEVTNKYKDKGLVPNHWIRKQTLSNSERYITEELKELEDKILRAEDEILRLEEELYTDFLRQAAQYVERLQNNAYLIGELDILSGLAGVAIDQDYVLPTFNTENRISIHQGRHPVIEAHMPIGESYIANDLSLDKDGQQIMVITGPNMSGKSAILRQTALICLMAQMGSYVPATSADLPILDRIFTRVGASDNITSGESTFMVEMIETANILNNLSDDSLLLLDEIGRGTSTYDGISIAWSIVEYLHDLRGKRPYTLFATHYHELNELAGVDNRISNYHVSTKKVGDQILFLRKLLPGSVEHSFGIYVAKMAGIPDRVITRAEELLSILEAQKMTSQQTDEDSTSKAPKAQPMQLSLFEIRDPAMDAVQELLEQTDINAMTPVEALLRLQQIKDLVTVKN